jgi:nitroimidazol reductase NimA-like FMN-containing flavoprotein (pyridoxamine 5'-phosphate oxidase superfamily)
MTGGVVLFDKVEMRRKDRLVIDRAWIDEALRDGQVINIALASPGGDPYALPMGYGYGDGVIYIHGASKGLKNDIIAINSRVSFNVTVGVDLIRDQAGAKFSNKYRSVTGFGEIEEITELDEKNRALSVLMKQYKGPHDDITEERSKSVWVAKIVIKKITGKVSGYPKP